MEPTAIIELAEFLSEGGTAAVLGGFMVVIIFLFIDRRRVIKRADELENKIIESKNNEIESIREIVDMYHQGNLNLSNTLTEIKIVLQTIQNSRRQ